MSLISTSKSPILALILLLQVMLPGSVSALTLPLAELPWQPVVDGEADEWSSLTAVTVPLHKSRPDGHVGISQIQFRGGTFQDRVYLYLTWDDPTEDTVHKPWVWDEEKNKYRQGDAREDRFVVQFAMSGDYTTNWLSGQEFMADTWHWKASRSNPLGLAHDKSLIITREKKLRTFKLELPDGRRLFIARPSDAGDKVYSTQRFRHYVEPTMPKYIIKGKPNGSVADVSAVGRWSQGRWHLEITRLLDTGHADDVSLPETTGEIMGGFAVFDRSENDDHAISETVRFKFLHQPVGGT